MCRLSDVLEDIFFLIYRPSVRTETFAIDEGTCAAVLTLATQGTTLAIHFIRAWIIAPNIFREDFFRIENSTFDLYYKDFKFKSLDFW